MGKAASPSSSSSFPLFPFHLFFSRRHYLVDTSVPQRPPPFPPLSLSPLSCLLIWEVSSVCPVIARQHPAYTHTQCLLWAAEGGGGKSGRRGEKKHDFGMIDTNEGAWKRGCSVPTCLGKKKLAEGSLRRNCTEEGKRSVDIFLKKGPHFFLR